MQNPLQQSAFSTQAAPAALQAQNPPVHVPEQQSAFTTQVRPVTTQHREPPSGTFPAQVIPEQHPLPVSLQGDPAHSQHSPQRQASPAPH